MLRMTDEREMRVKNESEVAGHSKALEEAKTNRQGRSDPEDDVHNAPKASLLLATRRRQRVAPTAYGKSLGNDPDLF